jgi:peptidoglycan hydrolase-like protein with peptidoglycan-binding domain
MNRIRHYARTGSLVVTIVLALLLGAFSAAAGELGTPVDYDLEFPVDGDHWFRDSFWDARSHGAHKSQDIFADKGVPVLAAADGAVRYVNWTTQDHLNPQRCCSVVIDHDDGWQSRYIHLNNDTPGTDDGAGWGVADGIVPGVRVQAGQVIGWVGDSGNGEDSAPHLHFQLHDPSGTHMNSYPALVAAGGSAVGGGLSDPAFDGSYAIRLGDVGLHVRRLQQVLAELGYALAADGDFGPVTDAAARRFQEASGLEPDGRFGISSKQALAAAYDRGAPPPPPGEPTDSAPTSALLRRGDRGEPVAVVQGELSNEGFDPGPIDGIFGPLTEAAVIDFQTTEQITVDGIVGPQTRRVLGVR